MLPVRSPTQDDAQSGRCEPLGKAQNCQGLLPQTLPFTPTFLRKSQQGPSNAAAGSPQWRPRAPLTEVSPHLLPHLAPSSRSTGVTSDALSTKASAMRTERAPVLTVPFVRVRPALENIQKRRSLYKSDLGGGGVCSAPILLRRAGAAAPHAGTRLPPASTWGTGVRMGPEDRGGMGEAGSCTDP